MNMENIELQVSLGDKTFQFGGKKLLCEGSNKNLVLLHGAKFSSQDWIDINTPALAHSWGWNVFALNQNNKMPGQDPRSLEPHQPGELLSRIFSELAIDKPVIVSPSLSGLYSLPFLCNGSDTAKSRCYGYVPVAPVGPSQYAEYLPKVDVPTLLVFGSNDLKVGSDDKSALESIPNHMEALIAGAGHACYLDKPAEWHAELEKFLTKL